MGNGRWMCRMDGEDWIVENVWIDFDFCLK